MNVKVKKGYVLFVGNRRYTGNDIVSIDEPTFNTQSWKVEIIEDESIANNRMLKREKATKR